MCHIFNCYGISDNTDIGWAVLDMHIVKNQLFVTTILWVIQGIHNLQKSFITFGVWNLLESNDRNKGQMASFIGSSKDKDRTPQLKDCPL